MTMKKILKNIIRSVKNRQWKWKPSYKGLHSYGGHGGNRIWQREKLLVQKYLSQPHRGL